jgi:glycosyltransferase involved in cell wall biosynthesis
MTTPSKTTEAPTTPQVRVEAVVSGRRAASSRFRVLQHIAPLAALGVAVHARPPRISKYAAPPARVSGRLLAEAAKHTVDGAKIAARVPAVVRSWLSDITWLEREMLPGHTSLEGLLHRPVLFDVDDAIWLLSPGHERAARTIAGRAACVLAGNDFIAEWFARVAPAVERVWTAVDTDRFVPLPTDDDPRTTPGGPASHDGSFVVGWTGSASSIRYLQGLSPAIGRFMKEAPDARLVVVADVTMTLPGVPSDRVEFVPWSPEIEAGTIARFDVGVMPLGSGQWAKGKCAFKMLQYMSCAVPCVVSPVGMNNQVLAMADVGIAASTEDEWVEALVTLHRDRALGDAYGLAGRSLAERAFSVRVIAPRLAAVMRRYR